MNGPNGTGQLSALDTNGLCNAILEIAAIVTSSPCISQAYQKFTGELRKLVEFDRANITLVDEAAGAIVIQHNVGQEITDWPPGQWKPLAGTRAQAILESGGTVIENDIQTDGPISVGSEKALKVGLRSSIAVPLKSGGRLVGILSLRCRRPNAFGDRERIILEGLANQIAPAIERKELRARIRQLSDVGSVDTAPASTNHSSQANGGTGPAINSVIFNAGLSHQEHRVLEFIAQGLENEQIADALHISTNTVKSHVRKILYKLNVDNRVQAALLAREHRLHHRSPARLGERRRPHTRNVVRA